jgi:hypothetical protein
MGSCHIKTNWLRQLTRCLMDRMLQYPAFFMRPSLGTCVLSVPVNRPLPPLLSDSSQVLYPSLWSLSLVVTHCDRAPGWLNCHRTSVSPIDTQRHVRHSHYYCHWHTVRVSQNLYYDHCCPHNINITMMMMMMMTELHIAALQNYQMMSLLLWTQHFRPVRYFKCWC